MYFWFFVATAFAVGIDAKSIGIRKGLRSGILDMGPAGWTLACLLLWIVAVPIYLIQRKELKRLALAAKFPD